MLECIHHSPWNLTIQFFLEYVQGIPQKTEQFENGHSSKGYKLMHVCVSISAGVIGYVNVLQTISLSLKDLCDER